MFGRFLRPVSRCITQRGNKRLYSDHGHGHAEFKYVTIDEVPSPQGPWKENFDKLNRKYNATLAAGVTLLAGTILAINQFELIFFNYAPPKPENKGL